MTTPQRITRRPYRRGNHHPQPEALSAGYELGRSGHHAFEGSRHHRRPAHRHLAREIARMQNRITELEQQVRRLQRQARKSGPLMEDSAENGTITRTPRRFGHARMHGPDSHMDRQGRKMGRIAHRAWRNRQTGV